MGSECQIGNMLRHPLLSGMPPLETVELQPLAFLEIEDHSHGNGDHDAPQYKVAVFGVELRHVGEVHSVNAGNEAERDEDGGNDGKYFHDLVHAVAYAGEVHIHHAGEQVAVGLYGVYYPDGVVIQVAQEEAG